MKKEIMRPWREWVSALWKRYIRKKSLKQTVFDPWMQLENHAKSEKSECKISLGVKYSVLLYFIFYFPIYIILFYISNFIEKIEIKSF